MKIAHISPRYDPYIGGVETHVKQISERLALNGFDTEVLTTDFSGKLPSLEEINGVTVRRFKAWSPNESYFFSRPLQKYLKENASHYDVLHAHSYHSLTTYYAVQAKKATNKLVFTPRYHGGGHTFFRNILHKPYKLMGKRIIANSEKIICLSQYEKSLLLSSFKVDEGKIVVIPNGVAQAQLIYKKNEEREKSCCKKILCVSRIEKYKGIQYVIKALPKIKKEVHLDIVGKGPYKTDLIKLTNSLNLENRISFYEDVPKEDLARMRSNSSAFVLLSQHEAFGNAVAEALSSTVPCIVANISALQEWVDDEICFGIDYPIDIERLADLISSVIEKSVQPRNLFTWDMATDKVASIYNDVFSN